MTKTSANAGLDPLSNSSWHLPFRAIDSPNDVELRLLRYAGNILSEFVIANLRTSHYLSAEYLLPFINNIY